jgi:transcriptional regulator with XRE-family HTH domain
MASENCAVVGAVRDGTEEENPMNKFEQFLKKRGLTLCALHRLSGISKGSIHGWKTGHHLPSKRSVYRIAKAIHEHPETLLRKELQSRESWQNFSLPSDKPVYCRTCHQRLRRLPPVEVAA